MFDEAQPQAPQTMALVPEDRYEAAVGEQDVVRLRLSQLRLERPRQWGGCWMAIELWRELGLDAFWAARLLPSEEVLEPMRTSDPPVQYLVGTPKGRLTQLE